MAAETPVPGAPNDASAGAARSTVAASIGAENGMIVERSLVGYATAANALSVDRSATGAVVARGDADVFRSAAGAVVARSITGERMVACTTVAEDIHVSGGWIGLALAKDIEVSEDSRVIIGPAGAAIIAVAILGVFGVVVALAVMGARRAMAWRPNVPSLQWRRMGG